MRYVRHRYGNGTIVSDGARTPLDPPATDAVGRIIRHPEALVRYQEICRRLFLQQSSTPVALAIGGIAPGQGTTTAAVGLAVALARAGTQNVVLIECDFSHPTLANRLRVSGKPGLGSLLDGSAREFDVIRPTPLPNLFFVPAGRLEPSGAHYRDRATAALIKLADATNASTLILDVPPVKSEPASRVWYELSTHVLVVVRAGHHSGAALEESVDLLGNCSIIGILLNQHHSAVPKWAKQLLSLIGFHPPSTDAPNLIS